MPIPKFTEKWEDTKKGIGKTTISFDSKHLIAPTEVSKVSVIFSNVQNLENRKSKFLEKIDSKVEIQMGSALNPIDFYIEILLGHLKKGELAKCFIKTSAMEITFNIKIIEIENVKHLFDLKLKEIFELAKVYKANGVEMYKKYPKFAEDYFCKGAKIMLSCKPFDHLTEKDDGVEGKDFSEFLLNLYNNIAACKIRDGKFEDVVYLTQSVEESVENASEKAVFRRALALCNLQKHEEAKNILDQFPNKNNEMLKLYKRIQSEWKVSDEKYANMVRKMFK